MDETYASVETSGSSLAIHLRFGVRDVRTTRRSVPPRHAGRAAFVASGEMAVAYFWVHMMSGGLFWWGNKGEPSMLFAFIFLVFAAWGAWPFSLDASIAKRRATSGDS